MKLEFKEKVRRSLEIDGVEYPVAVRTGALEDRIIEEYDDVRFELTEYERYEKIISLLLGDEAFKRIFPKGKEEDLDKMAQVAYYAQQQFNYDKNEAAKEDIDRQMKDIGVDRMVSYMSEFNTQAEKTMNTAYYAQQKRKKRKGAR